MLTLITYPGGFGATSLSPFCVKAEYLLNLSGLKWRRENSTDPRKAPRGKFPVLRSADGLIHDSDAIRRYLDEQGATLDAIIADEDRATAHGLRRMVEEHLYFLLVLDRWERKEVWPTIRETYFHEIPKMMRNLIADGLRRTLLKGMNAQGLGRLTWNERLLLAQQDLDAILAQLGDATFLFGDKPSSVDASVAAILGAIMATPVETPLALMVRDNVRLVGYVDRCQAAMGQSVPA